MKHPGIGTTILTVWILTSIDSFAYNIQMNGYRDVLCSLINKIVLKVVIKEKEALNLIFEKNVIVEISLREEDYEGPEVAIFKKGTEITVW